MVLLKILVCASIKYRAAAWTISAEHIRGTWAKDIFQQNTNSYLFFLSYSNRCFLHLFWTEEFLTSFVVILKNPSFFETLFDPENRDRYKVNADPKTNNYVSINISDKKD